MRLPFAMTATAVGIGALTLGATAATAQDVTDLDAWQENNDLQGSWRATVMTDTPVYGETGEDIGEVANIVVGGDGQVRALIVEAGGFFDIGDTHFSVPWDQVDLTPGEDGIRVPVNEENVEDFDLFGDDAETGGQTWRVNELLGDNVMFTDESGYGIVYDVLFGQDGAVKSVVVNPSVGYGVGGFYAYPWQGDEYGMAGSDYQLGFSRDDVAGIEAVDLDEISTDVL